MLILSANDSSFEYRRESIPSIISSNFSHKENNLLELRIAVQRFNVGFPNSFSYIFVC